MTQVNQVGHEVQEHLLLCREDLNPGEAKELMFLLLDHLNLHAVRTNATKHGAWVLMLKDRGAE